VISGTGVCHPTTTTNLVAGTQALDRLTLHGRCQLRLSRGCKHSIHSRGRRAGQVQEQQHWWLLSQADDTAHSFDCDHSSEID
jgi:hypothetical protein